MSQQIIELTRALATFEAKRVEEQRSMNEQVEQIKEQVFNLTHHSSR